MMIITNIANTIVVATNDEAPAVATDTGAAGSGDPLDEAIGRILEPAPVSLLRRHIARPDRDEGAYRDRGAGAHVKALGHRRAVVVEHEVTRGREGRRRQRRRHNRGQCEYESGPLEHLALAKQDPGPARAL